MPTILRLRLTMVGTLALCPPYAVRPCDVPIVNHFTRGPSSCSTSSASQANQEDKSGFPESQGRATSGMFNLEKGGFFEGNNMSMLNNTSGQFATSTAIRDSSDPCRTWLARRINGWIAAMIAHREYQANLFMLRHFTDRELARYRPPSRPDRRRTGGSRQGPLGVAGGSPTSIHDVVKDMPFGPQRRASAAAPTNSPRARRGRRCCAGWRSIAGRWR